MASIIPHPICAPKLRSSLFRTRIHIKILWQCFSYIYTHICKILYSGFLVWVAMITNWQCFVLSVAIAWQMHLLYEPPLVLSNHYARINIICGKFSLVCCIWRVFFDNGNDMQTTDSKLYKMHVFVEREWVHFAGIKIMLIVHLQ